MGSVVGSDKRFLFLLYFRQLRFLICFGQQTLRDRIYFRALQENVKRQYFHGVSRSLFVSLKWFFILENIAQIHITDNRYFYYRGGNTIELSDSR